ncbi:MAG: hypothetical protein VB122_06960, partial [Erysipelotrichales bacterium]|nr:hypothetical protein [Erysipelotrichales bacterium]
EPKNTRQFEEIAFNLTNLNHALLSYISAFGVHKNAKELTQNEVEFCNDVSEVLQYVTDLLSGKADINHLDSMIQKANYWEDGIEQLQNDEKNRRAGIIYNITHVSRELLVETKAIVKQ